MTNTVMRRMTERNLNNTLVGLSDSYMKIYDLYYSDEQPRDSAFLKDLIDTVMYISAILEVYARDNQIGSEYAIEKHNNILRIIETNIKYYKSKED